MIVIAMMELRTYKGRVIDARALPLRGGGWTAHFHLEHHRANDVIATPFESGQMFPSEEAALEAAIRMGEQKIDSGYIHGWLT
jgi:hypothetical protein